MNLKTNSRPTDLGAELCIIQKESQEVRNRLRIISGFLLINQLYAYGPKTLCAYMTSQVWVELVPGHYDVAFSVAGGDR